MASPNPQPPTEAESKRRILTHMNSSHQDSISRYLQHHLHLSSFTTHNALLTDISLDRMTFLCPSALPILPKNQIHTIHLSPPMKSYADARGRLEAMDKASLAALGRSPITIKEYALPYGFMLLVMLASAATFLTFFRRGNFLPGSVMYDMLFLRHVPNFAWFCYTVQPLLLGIMVPVHLFEAVLMARSRLRKHSVDLGSRLWWTWMASTFCEGYGAFIRFDGLVKAEEERRAKGKH